MKKAMKYTLFFISLLLLMLIFSNSAYAAHCEDFKVKECKGKKDSEGYECGVFNDKCEPKMCAAFQTEASYYNGKCPSDRCTTSKYKGVCLPKQGVAGYPNGILTCEDFGKIGKIGTYTFATDDLGNFCSTNSSGFKYTYEDEWKNNNNKLCEDYKEKDKCPDGRYDDLHNTCRWINDKCVTYSNQTAINQGGISEATGVDKEDPPEIIIEQVDVEFKCSDVKYLTSIWLFLRIAAPFVVVLFGSLDFINAVMASDEKKIKETRGKFIKRLIAFVLLIILPFVIQFIFENIGTYGSQKTCLFKCIVTNDTSSKGCD